MDSALFWYVMIGAGIFGWGIADDPHAPAGNAIVAALWPFFAGLILALCVKRLLATKGDQTRD